MKREEVNKLKEAVLRPGSDEKLRPLLRIMVAELFEQRELEQCWFPDTMSFLDAWGDTRVRECGNWEECDDRCPLVLLRELAGIKPTDHGGVE